MFAPTLRRDGGGGAFHQLQQGLLHAFARNIACDRGILGLARDLVDLVDIDDAALRLFDIIVAGLQQFEDDVLHILAYIARLGQRGGVRHGEGHVERLRQRLGEQRLTAAGGANEQDVRLGQFHIRVLRGVVQTLIVVVHRNGEHALGARLTDDIIVKHAADFLRGGNFALLLADETTLGLLPDDVVTQLHAFIADEDGRSGDQLAHLMLRFAAEAAVQRVLRIGAAQFGHVLTTLSARGRAVDLKRHILSPVEARARAISGALTRLH